MDAVTFTQERMKRQLDDLQDKTQGAPTEIFDMRERMMVILHAIGKWSSSILK